MDSGNELQNSRMHGEKPIGESKFGRILITIERNLMKTEI